MRHRSINIIFGSLLWLLIARLTSAEVQGQRRQLSSLSGATSIFPFVRPKCHRRELQRRPILPKDCFSALETMPFDRAGVLNGQGSFTATWNSCSIKISAADEKMQNLCSIKLPAIATMGPTSQILRSCPDSGGILLIKSFTAGGEEIILSIYSSGKS